MGCDEASNCEASGETSSLLQLRQTDTSCTDDMKWPNIAWAASGYNIYKADPFPRSGGVDGGLRKHVFEISYAKSTGSGTTSMCSPDGFAVMRNVGSALSITTDVISSTRVFSEEISSAFSVGGSASVPGKGGGSGKYSSESSTFTDMVTNRRNKLVLSEAAQSKFVAQIGVGPQAPSTDPGFASQIAQASSYNDFFSLFEDFGTHFPTSTQFGGRFYEKYYISEEDYKQVDAASGSEGFKGEAKLDAGASASVGVSSSASTGSNHFNGVSKERRLTNIIGGTMTATNNGALAWSTNSDVTPMPISFELRSICSHPAFKEGGKDEQCNAYLTKYAEQQEQGASTVDFECVWDLDCQSKHLDSCNLENQCVDEPSCTVRFYKNDDYDGYLATYGPFKKSQERGVGGGGGYPLPGNPPLPVHVEDDVSSITLSGACKKILLWDYDDTPCRETDGGYVQNKPYFQEGMGKKPGQDWGIPDIPSDLDNDVCGFTVWMNSYEEIDAER